MVVTALVIIDLFFADQSGLEEPLDSAIRRGSLAVGRFSNLVYCKWLLTLNEYLEAYPVQRFVTVETLQ
ncbi:hypothetical protein BN903_38 [Halorubrum sp. AJ67]|nr:hypothetical protein BN903_38 [Halorubrum sp. AJ67]